MSRFRIPSICILLLLLIGMAPAPSALAQEPEPREGWGSATVSDDLIVWVQDGSGPVA
ncbi:MAG: hypothetical protein R2848_18145 [Thermomicrobiales bacterium]